MWAYDGRPVRAVLLERLADTEYEEFLVYLMGPYTTVSLTHYLRGDVDLDDSAIELGALGSAERSLKDELEEISEWLRTEHGVNAFLAVDADIPTKTVPDETDEQRLNVIRQSKAYAAASNAVVFVLPKGGVRNGVNIEIGAVLSGFNLGHDEGDPLKPPQRFKVYREVGVESATIDAITFEYEVAITEYGSRSELQNQITRFIAEVLRAEQRGDLQPVDEELE